LAEADRQAVDRALRQLATNPRVPRLRSYELEGRERLGVQLRLRGPHRLFLGSPRITLPDVGTHDDVH
jgi:hypothetical protein